MAVSAIAAAAVVERRVSSMGESTMVGTTYSMATAEVAQIQTIDPITVAKIEKTTLIELLLKGLGLLCRLLILCLSGTNRRHQEEGTNTILQGKGGQFRNKNF